MMYIHKYTLAHIHILDNVYTHVYMRYILITAYIYAFIGMPIYMCTYTHVCVYTCVCVLETKQLPSISPEQSLHLIQTFI